MRVMRVSLRPNFLRPGTSVDLSFPRLLLQERLMGPIGFKELVVILIVVLLIFGAKKLKTIGSDLGSAVRGFKKSMNEGGAEESVKQLKADAEFSESAKAQSEKSEHKA